MKFSAVLITAVLSASTVMAAPGTAARRARNADRLSKRSANGLRQSRPMIPANVTADFNDLKDHKTETSNNWAGAVLIGTGYKGVAGTFVVPDPSLPSGGDSSTYYSAAAWVGIDGDTCDTSILQTGVDFNIQDGEVSFDAWYEWYPDYSYDFTGISFSAGDTVKLTIDATSTTAGTATVENVSTGKTVTHKFSGESDALCEYNAEWIVEDFTEVNGGTESLVPLVDFGTVTFTDAYATTDSGTVGVTGATIIDMISEDGNTREADTSLSGSKSVIVKYVG
ncbi:peptidase A4 family-domain-containing protein [Delphinella strobiligena]|nr:peptidase A4 family-domain-containing protein [Delphinella strobiligena]